MKKRSLVAAIAMLVVSAIVLTSSTYAWFASSSQAAVSTIGASVTNNNGALRIAPTGTYAKEAVADKYKVSITSTDYEGLTENLSPVSMSLDTGATAPTFKSLTFQNSAFTGCTDAAATQYLSYQFKVQYTNGGDSATPVKMTTTASRAEGLTFTYALVCIDDGATKTYKMISFGDSYVPVKAITAASIADLDGNCIINDGDTNYASTDMGTVAGTTPMASGDEIQVLPGTASATTEATITVYVWAEGQDANCNGTGISNLATQIQFALSV